MAISEQRSPFSRCVLLMLALSSTITQRRLGVDDDMHLRLPTTTLPTACRCHCPVTGLHGGIFWALAPSRFCRGCWISVRAACRIGRARTSTTSSRVFFYNPSILRNLNQTYVFQNNSYKNILIMDNVNPTLDEITQCTR